MDFWHALSLVEATLPRSHEHCVGTRLIIC